MRDATTDPAVNGGEELLMTTEKATGETGPVRELVALQAPLRRFVASRVRDSHQVDDIVQETMLRMLEVAPRLEVEALGAYTFTVARNLIHSGGRSEATARRNVPRLIDRHEPPRPDTAATDAEARQALGAALAKVNPTVRAQLLSRDLDQRPLHEIAQESNQPPGVLASQLHRTRARLRVDYLLALRKVALPTTSCQKVLIAISAADQRRQASLGAGQHLDTCSVCSDLSLPLVSRDHALAGWAPMPLIALGSLHGHLARLATAHPKTTTTAVASTGVAVVAAVAASVVLGSANHDAVGALTSPTPTQQSATPAPTPTPTDSDPTPSTRPPTDPAVPGLTFAGRPVVAAPDALAPMAGQVVRGQDVVVLSVPADEGFWVGRSSARMWVDLAVKSESTVRIRSGQRLTFTAVMTPNTAAFPERSGPADSDGRDSLQRLGAHLRVDPAAIHIR